MQRFNIITNYETKIEANTIFIYLIYMGKYIWAVTKKNKWVVENINGQSNIYEN